MRCDPIEKAVRWAKTQEKGALFPNWARLESKVMRAYEDQSKHTIMRNQVQIGFDNTLWPTLSRLLILGTPQLARKIHPRTSSLDTIEGRARLVEAYEEITGYKPKVGYWRIARDTFKDIR